MAVIVTSTVDTWIDQDFPSTSYGSGTKLSLNGTASHVRYAYIFMPRPFPLDCQIQSATLRVYVIGSWSGSRTVTAKRVTETWKESKLNWTNQPAIVATNSAAGAGTGLAADAVIEFDVGTMLQDVADGQPWFGVRLEVSDSATHSIHSSDSGQQTLWPTLEVDWVQPPYAPTNLVPNSGAISLTKPRLTWNFRDTNDDGTQLYSQVQVDGTEDMASPEYDSGMVANVNSAWDLNTASSPAFTALADGDHKYWRVKVTDNSGLESEWSDVSEMTRRTQGTLTITNPAASPNDFVEETTPPFAWTFTGRTQQAVEVTLFQVMPNGKLTERWRYPRTVTTATSVTLPENIMVSGRNYRLKVEVWDTIVRQSTAGDLAQVVASRNFTYNRSGSPTAVLTLTATASGNEVTLTWTRTTMPDYFSIKEDGEEKWQRLNPTEALVSGTTYRMKWWRSEPGTQHTYEVEAVVLTAGKLKHSGGNATATATPRGFGIVFVDDTDPQNPVSVTLRGLDGPDLAMGEVGETFFPVGSRRPVRITDALRGYEGTVSGVLLTAADRDTFVNIKAKLIPVRLIVADLNLPVVLGETSILPSEGAEVRWDASVSVVQVDEFTFEPG